MKTRNNQLQPVSKGEFTYEIRKLDKRVDGVDKRMDKFDKRMDGFEERMNRIDEKLDRIDKKMSKFVTKVEFEERIQALEDKMYTKEDHAKYMVWLDEVMTELRSSREERVLSGQHILRLDDTTVDHEKRIQVLEKSTHNSA